MPEPASPSPAGRDRAVRRVRALAWTVAAATAALSAGLSVVAAHAFKGHDGQVGTTAARVGARRGACAPRPARPGDRRRARTAAAAGCSAHGRAAAAGAGRPAGDVGRVVSEPGAARWPALGTTASVVVAEPPALGGARAAVEAELAAIDLACSRFRADSELSRLNAGAGRPGPRRAAAARGDRRRAARGRADRRDRRSDDRAGADPRRLRPRLRDARATRRARLVAPRVAGWRVVSVDRARGEVRIPRGVRLDLGATAKALAADRAAAAAAAAAAGAACWSTSAATSRWPARRPPGGWPVRVADDHRAPADAPGQTLTIRSGGLATSSTTVRRWGPARITSSIRGPAGPPSRRGAPSASRPATLRGRQHRQHRRDRARRRRAGLARGARPAGPARRSRRRGARGRRLAAGARRRHDRRRPRPLGALVRDARRPAR